jgi:hypothetical protein
MISAHWQNRRLSAGMPLVEGVRGPILPRRLPGSKPKAEIFGASLASYRTNLANISWLIVTFGERGRRWAKSRGIVGDYGR